MKNTNAMKKAVTLALALAMCLSLLAMNANAATYKTGDAIFYGSYEQNGKALDGAEPLEWLVLKVEDDRMLVFAKDCIDCKPYHNRLENITWEKCSLRKWLNEDFLKGAFSDEEQQRILTVENENPDHPRYGTSSGNPTQDQLFLLTLEEAETYFGTIDERKAGPTDRAVAKNIYVNEDNGLSWWWLRTTSYYRDHVTFVTSVGGVSYDGRKVTRTDAGVRPAMWISLDSKN